MKNRKHPSRSPRGRDMRHDGWPNSSPGARFRYSSCGSTDGAPIRLPLPCRIQAPMQAVRLALLLAAAAPLGHAASLNVSVTDAAGFLPSMSIRWA